MEHKTGLFTELDEWYVFRSCREWELWQGESAETWKRWQGDTVDGETKPNQLECLVLPEEYLT